MTSRRNIAESRDDAVLRQRGSLAVWDTPEAIAVWHPPRTGQLGQRHNCLEAAIETGHTPCLAFCRPSRQIEGLLHSVAALRGLSVGVLDHTTFPRRGPGLVLAKTLAQADGDPVRSARRERAALISERTRAALAIRKGQGAKLGNRTNLAQAQGIGPMIPGLLASVRADGAYDGEPVYQAVSERQPDPPVTVVIPPRSTAVPSPDAAIAPSQPVSNASSIHNVRSPRRCRPAS